MLALRHGCEPGEESDAGRRVKRGEAGFGRDGSVTTAEPTKGNAIGRDIDLYWQVWSTMIPEFDELRDHGFQRVFRYPREAERHMLGCITRDVQCYGPACEACRALMRQLHGYLLLATLERSVDVEICRHNDHIEISSWTVSCQLPRRFPAPDQTELRMLTTSFQFPSEQKRGPALRRMEDVNRT
jgi:hypothetical protein